MKTLITGVTLQVNLISNSFVVFTDYKLKSNEYNGFNPYKTLEEAQQAAEKMVNTCNIDFMSIVYGYTLKTLTTNDTVSEFIKVKY